MIISHRHRLIYFSIPKTGSEAVRRYLSPISEVEIVRFARRTPKKPFYSHMRPCEAQQTFAELGWEFGDYSKIATVRNPWARLASLFAMMERQKQRRFHGNFSAWLSTLEPTRPQDPTRSEKWWCHGSMTIEAFMAVPGDNCAYRAFRLEDGLERLSSYLESSGVATLGKTVEAVNGAPEPYDYRDYYTARDRALVAELYASEIERFEYQF
ncbi:sulfotransferase family 2 domain-containing protein [Reyranella sp.]|mgnify:CR=1 FL=1|uniref:sulfotransferase family 2 domain-containing protein n=1 Tax=Reyranella sp. TaxID=1929291 RepID=UPI003BAB288A